MKLTGIQMFKKLSVLLAVLLCSVFVFAAPVAVKAAPSDDVAQWESIHLTKYPLELVAGESSAGEVKGMLEVDRTMLTGLLQLFIDFYPQPVDAVPVLRSFPSSKDDCGLHTIFIKGP